MAESRIRFGVHGTITVILVLAGTGRIPAQASPTFTLSVDPCFDVVQGGPGTALTQVLDVQLTTTDHPDAETGAMGWSLSLAAEGVTITAITTRGTSAAQVDDEPPGLRQGGWERSELTDKGLGECEGRLGAVSMLVLSFTEPITLPPEGTQTVARITIEGEFPPNLGERTPARLAYTDGCYGAGNPTPNLVTWMGNGVDPVRGVCDFELEAAIPKFIRGDANDSGVVDLSDPVFILGCKFLGRICPLCRDAADANDDGRLDISDPILILNHLYLGGPPPAGPGPGTCGLDLTEDSLPPCDYTSCRDYEQPSLADFTFLDDNAQGYPEYRHDPTGIVFVRLPASIFEMGSPDGECGRLANEGPMHSVSLNAFLISKHEVTQAQWEVVMGNTPSYFRTGGLAVPEGTDTSHYPVERVSWIDARSFCRRSGLRLPTEAEWEFACRGGIRTAFVVGDTLTTDHANFNGADVRECEVEGIWRETTLPVDAFEPNGFGLHNLHGNVAEWCEDIYHSSFYSTPDATLPDPVATSGPTENRVVRGGHWAKIARGCRSAARGHNAPYYANRSHHIGFRVVRSSP